MRYMLDTNTLVYVLNARPQHLAVLQRFESEAPSMLCVSAITEAELRFGIEKSQRKDATLKNLHRVLDALNVAAFDTRAAESYGALRATLEIAGTPIGPLDTLIGAHALSLGLVLVTGNTREFERVKGLRIESWIPN